MEDLILKVKGDFTEFTSGLDKEMDAVKKEAADAGKNADDLTNKFKKTGDTIAASAVKSTKAYQDLGTTLKGTNDQIQKIVREEGLKRRLAEVNSEMKKISVNGKLFKELAKESEGLKTELKAISDEGLTLQQRYKAALRDVQNGVEGAAERAGLLKDQLDDAAESANELASGSRLEQFGNTFGSLAGKIASLDFEGASEKAEQLADISSKITFKEGFTGVKQLGSSLLNLGKALLTNPVFLLGGAIAALTSVVYQWVTAESAIEKEIRLSKLALEERQSASESAYNNEIKLAKALGETEAQIAQRQRNRNEELKKEALERLRIRLLEFDQQQVELDLREKFFKEEKKNNSEFIKSQQEVAAIRRDIEALDTQLRVDRIEAIKSAAADSIKADAVEIDSRIKRNEKIKEENEKAFNERLELLDKDKEAQELNALNTIKNESLLAAERTRINVLYLSKRIDLEKKYGKDFQKTQIELAEIERKQQEEMLRFREKLNQDIIDFEKKQKDEQDKLDQEQTNRLQKEIKKREDVLINSTKKLLENSKASYDEQSELLKFAFENRLITEEEYNKGVEELNKHRDQIYQEATKAISNSFADLFSALMENEEMGSEFAQAVAGFRIAMDLAQSLAATIKGAAEAASFGGPLAPFILGGYIASGIAQVATAFLRIKKLSETEPPQKPGEPKRLAAGSEYLFGGREGQDSIPALLMPGERVVTKKQNRKHFNDLSAIHHDRYDDYLRMNYIEPAVSQAVREAKENERERFAHSIASHLKDGKSWRGSNIVDTLNYMNEAENKRNKQLIKVIGKSKRPSLRKL